MSAIETKKPEQMGRGPFVLAGMSFIPLIGVLFGIIVIAWGLMTSRAGGKKLALVGLAGITTTVTLYSALGYFGAFQRGGVFDDLREQGAHSSIGYLMVSIEGYQAMHGSYPESLEALAKGLPSGTLLFINDPMAGSRLGEHPRFFYERADEDHYYLLGVGMDGIPFTDDDILPGTSVQSERKSGLIRMNSAEK